ncbi:MAG: hypothetical protein HKN51_00755 [Saprospiraceae bacterium]|nr:hypothetical protein [Saprospiraceae bacterium]
MNNLIKILLPIALAISFFSCENDGFDIQESVGETSELKMSIAGQVLDINGNPIINAAVIYNNEEKRTDNYGLYFFENVKVSDTHNHVYIHKDGYFENTRTFRSHVSTNLTLKTILLDENFKYQFNSEAGGIIAATNVTLEFPPNAIVTDDSGNEYNGTVWVAVKHLNPLDDDVNYMMPGDLTALDADGQYSKLTSYGMVNVTLKSTAGEKLQIAQGQEVTMIATIPNEILNQSPDQIEMWSFDFEKGLWIEEGMASKSGDHYIAKVAHFSSWNYDVKMPAIIMNGRIVDADGIGFSAYINVFKSGTNMGGRGKTQSNGYFSGAVQKDELLTVIVYGDECRYMELFRSEVGPFSQNVDVGEIVVNLPSNPTYQVTGELEDCDGNVPDNVVIAINDEIYFSLDGKFNISFSPCRGGPFKIKAIDLDKKTSSDTFVLQVGDNAFNPLVICLDDIAYVKVKSTDLGFEEIAYLETIIEGRQNNEKQFFGFGRSFDGNAEKRYDIRISYRDNAGGKYEEGAFDTTKASIEIRQPNLNAFFRLDNGKIIINEVNESMKYVKGSYNIEMEAVESNITGKYTFTGDFKLDIVD